MKISLSLFLLLPILLQLEAQQSYVNNKQLACEQNDTTTLGFVCNTISSSPSCQSYLTFRSTQTYNNPVTIAYLLSANASQISRLNNISDVDPLPLDTLLVIPINCSCVGNKYYQHNTSYILKHQDETYFTVANNTYQSLSTCQAMEEQNPYNFRRLRTSMNLHVPLRCACPSPNQTASGVKYLLTYLVRQGDTYSSIADEFSSHVQAILYANELSEESLIYYFTPLLVPLTAEPTKDRMNRVPTPPPPPPTPPTAPASPGSSDSKSVFVGVGVGVGLLLLLVISGSLFWFFRYGRGRSELEPSPPPPVKKLADDSVEQQPSWSMSVSSGGIRSAIETLTVYKFEDLQQATSSFGEECRINGSVYRASLKGDYAAVKIMKGDVSKELQVLRQINHYRIIRLSGFCLHQGITYLVYEYAEKGSLYDRLHGNMISTKKQETVDSISTGTLDWKQRVHIAYDIADALNYLHNFTSPPYIHKNMKSSNVLLDSNLRAKVANFGLARTLETDKSEDGSGVPATTRHVVGTYGYMAPEYVENGLITPKLDVFAFGVVMLELLSGREAVTKNPAESEMLSASIDGVLSGENVRRKLNEFMDPHLGKEYPLELAYSMAELARKCVAHDLNSRPSISEVCIILSKFVSSSLDWDPSDGVEYSGSLSHGR